MGNRTLQAGDSLNRLKYVTNVLSGNTKLGYDASGFWTSQVNEKAKPAPPAYTTARADATTSGRAQPARQGGMTAWSSSNSTSALGGG